MPVADEPTAALGSGRDECPPLARSARSVRLAGLLTDLLAECRRRDRRWFRDWVVLVGVPVAAAAAVAAGDLFYHLATPNPVYEPRDLGEPVGVLTRANEIARRHAYLADHDRANWVGVVGGVVFGGLELAGLVIWRRGRAGAAGRRADGLVGRVAAEYPATVAGWGGLGVLDRADTVAHVLRELRAGGTDRSSGPVGPGDDD